MRKTVTTKIELTRAEVQKLILDHLGLAADETQLTQFSFYDSNSDEYDLALVVVTEQYDVEGDSI